MAHAQMYPILAQLENARSHGEQNAALQTVKNDTIGHIRRKQAWVELGVLEPVVKVLSAPRPSTKPNGQGPNPALMRELSEGELARLRALELLGIFASGGPSFLEPLRAAGDLPIILLNLSPSDNHPRIVLAALRALVNLAEASSLSLSSSEQLSITSMADSVFTSQHLESLESIISASSSGWIAQCQVNAAAKLICLLCREERHQNAVADSGILDALATKLTSFAVARGQVVPGAEVIAQNEGLEESIPGPAPVGLDLAVILEAISVIIADSRLRACMLIYSPSILAVFPHVSFDAPASDVRASWNALATAGLSTVQVESLGAMDYLLPAVPSPPSRTGGATISPFPPLGSSLSRDNMFSLGRTAAFGVANWDAANRFEPLGSNSDADPEEGESPLIPWLIALARSSDVMERLMAASVLTSLYKSGFANKSREVAMSLLIVPLLMQILHDAAEAGPNSQAESAWVEPQLATQWAVTERSLTVLARLITDSESLQKAAFDCHAVKVVSKFLKEAYEPLSAQPNPQPWSPSPRRNMQAEVQRSPTCTLGPPGKLPLHVHRTRLRESALKAIAALVSLKDEYRKAFVEQEVTSYVVDSLSQTPSKPQHGKEKGKSPNGDETLSDAGLDPGYGDNPVGVLIAACHCVRMLSRSVGILRTTLQDAGVAMPIFRLLRHPEIDVQIAATSALCNLVTEVSPMREEYNDADVMKVLCEHAHSLNASLRLNALWALKHFVHGVGTNIKKACVEELEVGWLVRLICDDTEDEALFARTNEKQAAPSPTAGDLGEDMEVDQSEEDGKAWPSLLDRATSPRTSHERSRTGRLRQAELKISALHDAELNPVRKARADDLAIQEQGLNFIRNLIGPGPSGSSMDTLHDTTEMTDYLFTEIGQDRFFQILTSKLKPRVLRPFSRRLPANQSSRVLYPQAKIIEAVVFILVHISASVPRHRQLVIAQTELLKNLVGHFSSKDKDVRVALCHLLGNLTWRDDTSDRQAASQRAMELKRLGLLNKLQSLEQDDSDLDVRERAKTAIYQMSPQYLA